MLQISNLVQENISEIKWAIVRNTDLSENVRDLLYIQMYEK